MDESENTLVKRLLAGDVRALAQAITVVENDLPDAEGLLQVADTASRGSLIVGFTGSPGAGKSTLINSYISQLRQAERRVAVISVDPSSPLSGGAILGDRLRMGQHISDPGVFVRSGASRGHLGGLCRNVERMVAVIAAAGWEVIVLETVGAGQSEVEVTQLADVVVVLTSPGMGDHVQAMKAGILEVADVLVVNKADQPGAATTTSELQAMLKLREKGRQAVPVLETVATSSLGVAELTKAIDEIHERSGDCVEVASE